MKTLIIISIITFGLIPLPDKSSAAQFEKLTDSELAEITSGNLLEMIAKLINQVVILAGASASVNINELNSSTLVQSNLCYNVNGLGEIVNINSAEVSNDICNTTNILHTSNSTLASFQTPANINAINSATVVQSNLSFNVDSVTNINVATVTNSY